MATVGVERAHLDRYITGMLASEIRSRFLQYFARNGHVIRPSSSLVPGDDPTLLFTNAGMVQFKKVFLGMEEPPEGKRRATTSQKCVRAGGKHNDLEQVGHTARHNTFFEMLGNFSFGDYFKRDAIRFAWEFVTQELGLDPKYLRVSVHHSDDEARGLWREIAGLPDSRIYGLGDKDNFWQMADTGPCGPCSEIFVDVAHLARDWRFPDGATGEWTELDREEFSLEAFIEGSDRDRFIEFWNLVFMQFDEQPDGTLVPLPKPSVDTGAGLERISAITQGVTMIYHTDLFAPMIAAVEQAVGIPYWGRESTEMRTGVRFTRGARVGRRAERGGSGVVPRARRPCAFGGVSAGRRRVSVERRTRLRAAPDSAARGSPRVADGPQGADARLGRAGGHRFDGRRLSGASPARAAHRQHDARGRAGLPRHDRGRAGALRSARAGVRPRMAARTFAARSAAKTRSVSTTPSASRSTSPS